VKRLIFGKGKVSKIISGKTDTVLSRDECDISCIDQVLRSINEVRPSIVINCAAKTNLENCQEDKVSAFSSNTVGVLNVLRACSDNNIKLVHVSSGCLFDGNSTVSTELSSPTPAVWYTWTKTWADQIIQNFGYDNFLILRPRQLISKVPHPTNMITKFSNMSHIPAIDEANSLTCIEDFKEMIDHLISQDERGIFNCCNTGTITPYEIAQKIKETINPDLVVETSTYEDLLDILPNRRVNTILSCDKLIKTGYNPRSAKEALLWCIENYGK
jgi:dTDP-4-dehydrorhamnose reductase